MAIEKSKRKPKDPPPPKDPDAPEIMAKSVIVADKGHPDHWDMPWDTTGTLVPGYSKDKGKPVDNAINPKFSGVPGMDIGGPVDPIEEAYKRATQGEKIHNKPPYPGADPRGSSYVTSTAEGEWKVDHRIYHIEKSGGASHEEAMQAATRFIYDPKSIWGAPKQYRDRGLNVADLKPQGNLNMARLAADSSRGTYLRYLDEIKAQAAQETIVPRMNELAMQKAMASRANVSDPLAARGMIRGLSEEGQAAASKFAPMAAKELQESQEQLAGGYDTLRGRGFERAKAEQRHNELLQKYRLKKAIEDEKAKQFWHSIGLDDKEAEDAARLARGEYADELIREEDEWTEEADKLFSDTSWKFAKTSTTPIVSGAAGAAKRKK